MTNITVKITETINYTKTYTVEELESLLDTNLADMSAEEIASYIEREDRVEEDMQNYGDVWGSRWQVAPGDRIPVSDGPVALVTDDGTDSQAMVLDSRAEVYAVLRENFAQGENVEDDDLIDHVRSQGILVYVS